MNKKTVSWVLAALLLNICEARAESRIVGGADAAPESWPWMVSLSKLDNNYQGHFCGGALVSSDWVVTAAHCVQGDPPNSFHVVAGVYNLKEDPGQQLQVKRIIVHPKYDPLAFDYDIALLQLKTPVADAVPLPLIGGNPGLAGVMATVIGWGNMSDNMYNFFPFKLQEVQVPIVSNRECRDVFEQKGEPPTTITNNMLCAGSIAGGEDSCQGDSGGPLMVMQEGQWVLAGIVSWGDGCALPLNYGVYSRVSKLAAFVEARISVDYLALADANHDGKVNRADRQAKSATLQEEMKEYVDQCWTPAASCGDLTGDSIVDWRDLVKQGTALETGYKTWLETIWDPERAE